MFEENTERPKPMMVEVSVRGGLFATVVASTASHIGDPDDTREGQYEEGMRIVAFLREAADRFEEEVQQELGPEA
jgi:hypothetical protein